MASADTAVAVCDAIGEFIPGLSGCTAAIAWPATLQALATGQLREHDVTLSEFCSN